MGLSVSVTSGHTQQTHADVTLGVGLGGEHLAGAPAVVRGSGPPGVGDKGPTGKLGCISDEIRSRQEQ